MAVFHKVANYSFLEKIGVGQTHIQLLKDKNIALGIGFYDIKFYTKEGVDLGTVKLSKSTNDLAKGMVPASVLNMILSTIQSEIIKIAGGDLPAKLKSVDDVVSDAIAKHLSQNISGDGVSVDSPANEISTIVEGVISAEKAHTGVVALRDATHMYQPVKGTDLHSVYYVVALSKSAKVAVKVSAPTHYSVRVEGDNISAKAKAAMEELGISEKGKYLSGHFSNPESVPIQRSVGALLTSMAVDWESPIPNMDKVITLCGAA